MSSRNRDIFWTSFDCRLAMPPTPMRATSAPDSRIALRYTMSVSSICSVRRGDSQPMHMRAPERMLTVTTHVQALGAALTVAKPGAWKNGLEGWQSIAVRNRCLHQQHLRAANSTPSAAC